MEVKLDIFPLASVDQWGRLHRPPNDMVGAPKPLIVFLHGHGERGTDNLSQINGNINNLLARTKDVAYIYAPQLPATDAGGNTINSWGANALSLVHVALAKIMTEYNVAWDQVYVTGLSMGGGGTWASMRLYPLYAAGIPICGANPAADGSYEDLVTTPIWAFHVDGDATAGALTAYTRNRINDIRAAAGLPDVAFPVTTTAPYPASDGTRHYWDQLNLPSLRYSEYPRASFAGTYLPPGTSASTDAHSFSWKRAYHDSEPVSPNMMYDWMWSQTKGDIFLRPGESVFIDFGSARLTGSDSQGRGKDTYGDLWNAAHTNSERTPDTPIRPAFARATTGRQTGVVARVTDVFGGVYTGGPALGTIYDENIAKDGWVTNINDPAALTFHGLTPNASYRLTLFARATDNDGGKGRGVRYQVGGLTRDLTSDQVVNNVGTQAIFESVQADAGGTLTLQIAPLTSAGRGLLNALELTRLEHAQPAFFAQDFSSSTNYLSYVSSTLAPNLFSDISAEADTNPWSIQGGKLTHVGTTVLSETNSAGFTRLSGPVAGAPDVMEFGFKVSTSGVSGSMEMAAIDVGTMTALQDYSGSTPSVATTNRLAFKAAGAGLYKFVLNATSSPTYPANGSELAVSWVLNQSGSARTYRGQDGLQHAVDSGSSDLWVNGTKALANVPRNSAWTGTKLGGFRFRTEAVIPVTFKFDDFLLSPTLPQ